MTDRELLELAAKAAELQIEWVRNPAYIQERWEAHIPCGWVGQPSSREWNPLREPGDAFDLAVKLRLVIQHAPKYVVVMDGERNIAEHQDTRENDGDAYRATRRAIVCAAAEIGRAK